MNYDLEQKLAESIELGQSGVQLYGGGDGNLYTQDDIDRESFQAMSRKERRDAPAITTPQEGLQRFTEAMGGAALGAVPGAVAGTVGAPGDIIGLLAGAYEGLTAEEGQKLDTFLNTMAGISEDYGSEVVLKFIREAADVLPVSDQVKEGIKAGAEAGSFVGVGGAVTAGAKGTAKATRTLKGMVGEPFETPRTPSPVGGSPDAETGQFIMTKDGEFIRSTGYVSTKPDFKKLLDSKVDSETLEKHPHVENTTNEMLSRPTTEETAKQQGVWNTLEWQESRDYTTEAGEKIKGYEAATDWLVNHAKTFAWTDDKMTPPANPVKQDKELIIIVGPPAAGKSTLANPIARTKGAMIVDADEAKKLIPGYDNGVGANVVHEESSQINKLVFKASIQTGNNIVVPIVGGKAEKVVSGYIGPAKELGYKVTLVDMMVDPEVALQRMYSRFVSKDRLIPPEVAKVGTDPTKAFDELVEQGAADAYTKIDNNPGKGEPRVVIRDDDNIIEASGIDATRLGSSSGRGGGSDGQARVRRDGEESSPASNGQVDLQSKFRESLPEGVKLDIEEGDGFIRLNRIVVPKELRNEGVGSKFMQDLVDYADENNLKLVLTAAGDFGGSKAGQMRLYKRFGFKENKGRNKDFEFRDTMIRTPQ